MTADTNILVRAIVGDDEKQSQVAKSKLAQSDLVALTNSALCELVWVLSRGYGRRSDDVADMLHKLIDVENVALDRQAASAGLAILAAGGDFADGVIAYEGRRLGGEVFLSFDRKATRLIQAQGGSVELV